MSGSDDPLSAQRTDIFEATVLSEIRALRKDHDTTAGHVAKLVRLLDGGDEPQKGVIIRLDRLEQSEHIRSRAMWVVGSAALTALASAFWRALKSLS